MSQTDIDQLVDAFVAAVNTRKRVPETLTDVPPALRLPLLNEFGEEGGVSTDWRVIQADHAQRISELERRIGLALPPSLRSLVCRYSFPAFESGPVMLFANTGGRLFWEFEDRLFKDPVMSPLLLAGGYIQIGNPMFYDYDPVCIEANPEGGQGGVLQLDHEEALCNGRLVIVRRIADSFVDLLRIVIDANV